jgi:hypothetical protein
MLYEEYSGSALGVHVDVPALHSLTSRDSDLDTVGPGHAMIRPGQTRLKSSTIRVGSCPPRYTYHTWRGHS